MKKQILIIMVLGVLFVILCGCTTNNTTEEDRFIGTWKCSTKGGGTGQPEYYNSTMILYSDGTVDGIPIYSTVGGTWDIKDNKLVLNVEIFQSDTTYSYSYVFSDNDKTLKLTDLDTDKITVCLKQ